MTTARLSDPAASRAILIGAHDYQNLPSLPAVERSLTALAWVLGHSEVWGLPPEHCTVLPQPENAHAAIDALEEAASGATDTLLFYYAGHGLIDQHNDELVLALPGSRPNRPDTGLRYEYVRRAIADPRIAAQKKVVVLDCCYSGRAMAGEMTAGTGLGDQVADHARIEGTFLLTATAETRKALSPPGETYTAFTGELITALATGVPDGPAHLDMETLYRHLHTQLTARGRPAPQQRNRNSGALIALARNRAVAQGSSDTRLTAVAAPDLSGRTRPTRRVLLLTIGGLAVSGVGAASWLGLRQGTDGSEDRATTPKTSTEETPSPTGSRSGSESRSAGTAAESPATSPKASPEEGDRRQARQPKKKWTSTFEQDVIGAPVMVGDTLWIAGALGQMYPTSAATGTPIGLFETGGDSVLPQPSVSGGVVYVGAQLGNQLYAIDGTSARRLWTFEAGGGVNSQPAVSDGSVFVSCFNGVLYAVNARTGKGKWSFPFGTASAFPCAAADGRVFVTQADLTEVGSLRAVSARDGKLLWRGGDPRDTHGFPAVYGDTLLVSTWDVGLRAFDAATGKRRWTYSSKGPGVTGGITLAKSTAYFGSPSGLHAVDARNGQGRWTAPVANVGGVAVAGGVVYTGSSDKHLHALDESTGDELWKLKLSGANSVLVADGVAYVTSGGKELHAITV